MFETSETTFEVFFLMSYVVFDFCGRFFMEWWNGLFQNGKKHAIFE